MWVRGLEVFGGGLPIVVELMGCLSFEFACGVGVIWFGCCVLVSIGDVGLTVLGCLVGWLFEIVRFGVS